MMTSGATIGWKEVNARRGTDTRSVTRTGKAQTVKGRSIISIPYMTLLDQTTPREKKKRKKKTKTLSPSFPAAVQ